MSLNNIALAGTDHIFEIENGLFPVSVGRSWASAEANRLVAEAELDVKPADQSMDIVIPLGLNAIGDVEREVLFLDSHDINVLHTSGGAKEYQEYRGIAIDHVAVHGIYKRFSHGYLLNGTHVEAVHILPEMDFAFLVVLVFDGRDDQAGFVRENKATRSLKRQVLRYLPRTCHGQ